MNVKQINASVTVVHLKGKEWRKQFRHGCIWPTVGFNKGMEVFLPINSSQFSDCTAAKRCVDIAKASTLLQPNWQSQHSLLFHLQLDLLFRSTVICKRKDRFNLIRKSNWKWQIYQQQNLEQKRIGCARDLRHISKICNAPPNQPNNEARPNEHFSP